MSVERTPSRGVRPTAAAVTVLAAAAVLLAACAGTTGGQVRTRAGTASRSKATTTTAGPDCAQTLPPEAQAAQMLLVMVTTPPLAAKAIADGSVGGFGLKGNQTKDVGSQVAAAVKDAPIAPFVGADEEGGTVQRLRLALGDLPAAATVAKGTPQDAAAAAGDHAKAMARLGFNVNFAPVADVGSGSGLGTRTYGSDPGVVSSFVNAVFPAIQKAGVMPVVKHWPGIGGGKDDPHVKVTTLADIQVLRTRDLLPFDQAIDKGAPAIMVTHAEVPGLTRKGEPASLSSAAITGELRGRERFKGLVITDALGMAAISKLHDQPEAAELAITAGADVAMVSGADSVDAVHSRLVEAITSGRIPESQVLASVRRVLAAKGIEGACLDAVARYSALARTDTTIAGQTTVPGVTTTTAQGSSAATTTTGQSPSGATTTGQNPSGATTTTLRRTTTTGRVTTTGPTTTAGAGVNG